MYIIWFCRNRNGSRESLSPQPKPSTLPENRNKSSVCESF